MKKYAVVIEKGPTNYGAYVPDLPGCVAVADTVQEVEQLIREAIPFHIEGLRLNGDPVPEPTTLVEFVDAGVAA
jgi:predicted RNase H-like HicB family nuclease